MSKIQFVFGRLNSAIGTYGSTGFNLYIKCIISINDMQRLTY